MILSRPRHLLRRRAWTAVPVLVALGAAAACSAPASGEEPVPQVTAVDLKEPTSTPTVRATPVILDSAHLRLPLDAYLLSDRERADLISAQDLLVTRCAARYGVTVPARPRRQQFGPHTYTERRYGLTDPVLAAEDGYHLGDRDPRKVGKPPTPDLSPTQILVLTGSRVSAEPAARRSRTQQVPAGGCLGEAERKLGGAWDNSDLVELIDNSSVVQATKDDRVRATFRAWSGCMKAKGHHYAAPWDAGNDPRFRGPHSSPAETAVAVADVACKQKTNVVGVWYATDAAYQKAFITANKPALDQAKRDKASHLRLAHRALGRP